MSTICFDPMEIKGLAESLIASGHDREFVYDTLQAAHVANALAYEARYGDETETYDIRDSRIRPDMGASLVNRGVSLLIYNCDRQLPNWLEDRLYAMYPAASVCEMSRWELNERELDRCGEAAIEAVEDGMPAMAAHFARRAAHLGRILSSQLPASRWQMVA